MDLLFLLHFPPPTHGSSVVGKAIKDSKLINSTFECRFINLLSSRKVDETGRISAIKVFRFIGTWFQLLLAILKKKPSLCYFALTTSGSAFYRDLFLVALLRLFGTKRVYHLHSKGVGKHRNSKINPMFYRFVFYNANVILLSKLLYGDIQDYVPESRVYICPNGIDANPSNAKEIEKQRGEKVKILFLSNLIQSKGVFVLLDACSILHEKNLNFECDYIGDEGDITAKQFNERVIEKALTGKVNYLGKKFGTEKHQHYSKADIFVLPTYYSNECFPLVLLEAMEHSLPIISTFEGGIPDAVDDGTTGFLVSQKDAEALAEKLEILIQNPTLRQQMGSAGYQKYKREFTLEIFEEKITEILHKVLEIKI